MNEHLDPADLDRFAGGGFTLPEKRHLLGHLLQGCPQCCGVLAERVILSSGPSLTSEEIYGAAVTNAIRRSLASTTSRKEALAVVAALLDPNRLTARAAVTDPARLQGLARIQACVEAGRAMRYEDPRGMLSLLKLAHAGVNRLRTREIGRAPMADLRALVWAELANAHRICDELQHADRAIAQSIRWCHRGTGSDLLLARVTDLLASICAYQRRFAEGQRLLAVVYRAHVVAGRRHLAGRALVSQGTFASWEGSPRTALRSLLRGFELLDFDTDPQLAVDAGWAMLNTLVDLGHFRRARHLLWSSRTFFSEYIEPHRLRWLEARIYDGLGDWARAEPAFQQARAGFAAQGQAYPAALIGLDLAALWARQHRVKEVYALAEEMIATFRALRIAREAITVLLLLKKACEQDNQILGVIDVAVTMLRDLERQPTRPRA